MNWQSIIILAQKFKNRHRFLWNVDINCFILCIENRTKEPAQAGESRNGTAKEGSRPDWQTQMRGTYLIFNLKCILSRCFDLHNFVFDGILTWISRYHMVSSAKIGYQHEGITGCAECKTEGHHASPAPGLPVWSGDAKCNLVHFPTTSYFFVPQAHTRTLITFFFDVVL